MKRIETRENEFVVQFKELLLNSFPHVLDFKVDYFVGEDKGVKGLYFTMTSKFGRIYTKIEEMKPHQTVYDLEEGFMDKVINDLMLTGVTFMNVKAFESISPRRVEAEIKAKHFVHSSPRKLYFTN
jgi:hypothetical protein